jgi:hypothetical protein
MSRDHSTEGSLAQPSPSPTRQVACRTGQLARQPPRDHRAAPPRHTADTHTLASAFLPCGCGSGGAGPGLGTGPLPEPRAPKGSRQPYAPAASPAARRRCRALARPICPASTARLDVRTSEAHHLKPTRPGYPVAATGPVRARRRTHARREVRYRRAGAQLWVSDPPPLSPLPRRQRFAHCAEGLGGAGRLADGRPGRVGAEPQTDGPVRPTHRVVAAARRHSRPGSLPPVSARASSAAAPLPTGPRQRSVRRHGPTVGADVTFAVPSHAPQPALQRAPPVGRRPARVATRTRSVGRRGQMPCLRRIASMSSNSEAPASPFFPRLPSPEPRGAEAGAVPDIAGEEERGATGSAAEPRTA